ncbi:hypothetical protein [Flavobacterium sp. 25HG05S-40]|uniref:hypothetical protein n=1 Tax=Flavobacterium sp. 25HG05S-40 TaxID=3458682 RepID=UPI00404470BC
MKLQLIDGAFSPTESIEILTQLYHVKIKFHEEKVKTSANEEDIKMREGKIKALQKNLEEARAYINSENKNFHMEGIINF